MRMLLAALCLIAAFTAGGLPAQIPEEFTNLKVLPTDIPRRQLIDFMRSVAGSLGVRCNYCHPGGDPNTLEGVDFAIDSLDTKRVARLMLEMVRTINRTTLAEAQPDSSKRIELECATCHRGVARPERLDRMLFRIARDRGLDSATAEYRRLREAYFGSAAYDFSERTLVLAAEFLRGAAKYPEALGLLRTNVELFPQSAETVAMLGVTHAAAGDTANAIAAFRRALELRPNNQFLVQQLKRLGG